MRARHGPCARCASGCPARHPRLRVFSVRRRRDRRRRARRAHRRLHQFQHRPMCPVVCRMWATKHTGFRMSLVPSGHDSRCTNRAALRMSLVPSGHASRGMRRFECRSSPVDTNRGARTHGASNVARAQWARIEGNAALRMRSCPVGTNRGARNAGFECRSCPVGTNRGARIARRCDARWVHACESRYELPPRGSRRLNCHDNWFASPRRITCLLVVRPQWARIEAHRALLLRPALRPRTSRRSCPVGTDRRSSDAS